MSLPERVRLAAADPDIVIGAEGLLAEFNDAGILAPIDVLSAMTIGRIYREDDPEVLLAAALTVRGTRFGHVCIRIADQPDAVFVDDREGVDTESLPWPRPDAWEMAVAGSSLVGDGTGDRPLVLVGDRLYLQRYNTYENMVAGFISDRIGQGVVALDDEFAGRIEAALMADGRAGTALQRHAVARSLTSRFTVIAGGPGTGKTHTIAGMLSALARGDGPFPTVALAAPTGKAAARLGEAITEVAGTTTDEVARGRLQSVEASTIHRLLGYHPARGRFRHDADNPLPHDLVIIDEMSMVSLPLAARLLSAIRDDATVVLVGDPNQLESIEAGTVLADIVGPAGSDRAKGSTVPIAEHVVVLDRVHRYSQHSAIADFADAVRDGKADEAIRLLGAGSEGLAWIRGDEPAEFSALVERVVDHRAGLVTMAQDADRVGEALEELSELAVLSAHHRGPQSVDRWRRLIEDALDERLPDFRIGTEWYPGQPVMITANDYTLDLYNGDIGVTVATADGPRVAFARGGIRTFPRSHIGDHTTVQAMTIHKSQGSQFTEVVVALPAESSRLLTRQLLYTAVTRASTNVTLVGDETVIRHAIERSVARASGLRPRLWGTAAS